MLIAIDPLTALEQSALTQHEAVIERGLQTFVEVGNALMAIRDGRLYRQSHDTFEDYCRERWQMTAWKAYDYIKAAKVVGNIGDPQQTFTPANLEQARPLAQLPPEVQPLAWQDAIETSLNGQPTGAHVAAIVATYKEPEPPDDRVIDPDTGEIETPEPLYVEPTGRQKPKTNRAGNEYEPQGFDACQTPAYALDPLCGYLDLSWKIWEPATGEGLLVEALYDCGFSEHSVYASDLLTGQNFFEFAPDTWDCLITNPPYSIKYKWLAHCYELGKPFALLLPVETLGAKTAQVLFRQYGLEVIFLDRRVNFKMPLIGWDGSAAQFPVAWFTWGLNIGQQMTFAELTRND